MLRRKSEGEGNEKETETEYSVSSPSFVLRSVLLVIYAPAEVIIFLSADIPRKILGASLRASLSSLLKVFFQSNDNEIDNDK